MTFYTTGMEHSPGHRMGAHAVARDAAGGVGGGARSDLRRCPALWHYCGERRQSPFYLRQSGEGAPPLLITGELLCAG